MPMDESFAASTREAFARKSRTAAARRFDRRRLPAPVPVVSVCPSIRYSSPERAGFFMAPASFSSRAWLAGVIVAEL
jgi:hypothetical protein